ncbi:MAG: GNAT family N-acetyltransferase [Alistipes sp.]|nr:GNAT family N-acetyltransferase [Alistipes sp.]MBO7263790.1 GNAT family N-acetyltransferase [Alistipes sp.]
MIRKATKEDISQIMSIVADAQLSLRELGIDQWQDGYPSMDVIEDDIASDVGYVYCIDDIVVGYVAIVLTGEVTYKQIPDNEWGTSDDYVVVHRLCVRRGCTKAGTAMAMIGFASQTARERGYTGFRIDTHRGNIRMLSLLEKLGFEYRGIIYYDSGERLAYDLKLNNSLKL